MNIHMRLTMLMVLVVTSANAMEVGPEFSFQDMFEYGNNDSLTPVTLPRPKKSALLIEPTQYNDFLKNKTRPLAIPGKGSKIPSSDTQEVMPRSIACSSPKRTTPLQLLIENQCRTGILNIEGIKSFLDDNPKENVSDTAQGGNNVLHAIVREAGRIAREVMTNRLDPERSKKLGRLSDLVSITGILRDRNICRVATNKNGCTAKGMADALFAEFVYCEEVKLFLEQIKELIDPEKAKE